MGGRDAAAVWPRRGCARPQGSSDYGRAACRGSCSAPADREGADRPGGAQWRRILPAVDRCGASTYQCAGSSSSMPACRPAKVRQTHAPNSSNTSARWRRWRPAEVVDLVGRARHGDARSGWSAPCCDRGRDAPGSARVPRVADAWSRRLVRKARCVRSAERPLSPGRQHSEVMRLAGNRGPR
jgi:hypothetical protein